EINEFSTITKADVVKFANDFFKDNYVAIKKEKGVNDILVRVENPGITPIKLNKDAQSPFLNAILTEKSADIKPEFVDFTKAITTAKVHTKNVSSIENQYIDVEQTYFILPLGNDHDKQLRLAAQVLK